MATRTLHDALYDLLFVRHKRAQFLAGDIQCLGLEPADAAALATIDRQELEKTAARVIRDLLGGTAENDGGLRKSYPGVFSALAAAGLSEKEVAYRFAEGSEFRGYREVPFVDDPGTCVEEAFFLFLRGQPQFIQGASWNPFLLVHEFLTAMMAILAANERPHFSIVSLDLIRHNGHAWFSTYRYPEEVMERLIAIHTTHHMFYAASSKGTFIAGALDPLTISVVELGSREEAHRHAGALCERYGIDIDALALIGQRLADLGLIAPSP